jgi:hypothetical protein
LSDAPWVRRSDRPQGPPAVVPRTLKYKEAQEHLLRRLGSALVLQWDALPDALQDLIIDQAVAVEDRDPQALEANDVENFIRTAKTSALSAKAAAPDGDAK